jgi:hypothetical protein
MRGLVCSAASGCNCSSWVGENRRVRLGSDERCDQRLRRLIGVGPSEVADLPRRFGAEVGLLPGPPAGGGHRLASATHGHGVLATSRPPAVSSVGLSANRLRSHGQPPSSSSTPRQRARGAAVSWIGIGGRSPQGGRSALGAKPKVGFWRESDLSSHNAEAGPRQTSCRPTSGSW